MKRLSLALAAIGLSTGALAAYPAATDPTVVSVPQLPGGFFIGATGAYLQPSDSNGDLDYASVDTFAVINGTTAAFNSQVKNVEPGYDWGWGVNVGYIFPNTGNDVNLSYFNLDTSDTANVSGVQGLFEANPVGVVTGPVLSGELETPNQAAAKAEYDLNQVDLTVGQYINVGCRLIMHPNVGLRWAQVERTLNSGYAEVEPTGFADALGVKEDSNFSGIGPIAGLDASYYLGMGFGAVAHVDSALLIGSIDSKTDALFLEGTTFNSTPVAAVASQLKGDNVQRIVPVVDMKLGADYTYVFNNAENSDLTLEAGWMASNYFNAVDRVPGVVGSASVVNGTPVLIPSTSFARKTSDFGMQGPYVSLTFHA